MARLPVSAAPAWQRREFDVLSLQTNDAWNGSIIVDVLVIGVADTFNMNASHNSAFEQAQDFAVWLNDAARPWAGVTWEWDWSRQESTSGATFTFSNGASQNTSMTFDATAAARFGIASQSGHPIVGANAASGTFAPPRHGYVAIRRHKRQLDENGNASGAGCIRPGVPGLAHYLPQVSAAGTAQDAARMADIQTRGSHPRRAWIRDQTIHIFSQTGANNDGWHQYALGKVERARVNAALWSFTFNCVGDAI